MGEPGLRLRELSPSFPSCSPKLEAGKKRVTGLNLTQTRPSRPNSPAATTLTAPTSPSSKAATSPALTAWCLERAAQNAAARSDAVLAEVQRLADAGYTEIQFLGQTVNSYRDSSPRGMNFVDLLARHRRSARNSPRALYHFASARPGHRTSSRHRRRSRLLRPRASAGRSQVRRAFYAPCGAPILARVSRENRVDSRARRVPSASPRTSLWAFPGETEHDFEDTLSLLDRSAV